MKSLASILVAACSCCAGGTVLGADTDAGKPDPVEVAKAHMRHFMAGEFDKLEKSYAKKVVLVSGHELLKKEYGLAGPKGRTESTEVERGKLIGTMKEELKDLKFNAETVGKVLEILEFKKLKVKSGEYVADPSDPVDTSDGKIRFKIKSGDVLIKVGPKPPKRGDHQLFQLRKIEARWRVVAEYLD